MGLGQTLDGIVRGTTARIRVFASDLPEIAWTGIYAVIGYGLASSDGSLTPEQVGYITFGSSLLADFTAGALEPMLRGFGKSAQDGLGALREYFSKYSGMRWLVEVGEAAGIGYVSYRMTDGSDIDTATYIDNGIMVLKAGLLVEALEAAIAPLAGVVKYASSVVSNWNKAKYDGRNTPQPPQAS